MKKDPWALLKPISDSESCRRTIKDVSIGFYFLAVLQGAVGYFLMPSMLIDAGIIAILAIFVHTIKSRIAAILLCILALLMFATTVLSVLGVSEMGGKNFWLAIIAAWCGIKAVEGTFKYHKKYRNVEQGAAANP